MPTFVYRAKISPSKITTGLLQAQDHAQAADILISRGYFPISVKEEASSLRLAPSLFRKISGHDVYFFSHQLATLLRGNVNVFTALETIAANSPRRQVKIMTRVIAEKVKDGASLSQALSQYPYIFGQFYLAMVACAEAGGTLAETLAKLATYQAREEENKSAIMQALAYPFLVAGLGILMLIFLLWFVIPRIAGMFENVGQKLPLFTRMLIDVSRFFTQYGILGVAAVIVLTIGFKKWLRRPSAKKIVDGIMLRLPRVKDIIIKINVRNFCASTSALLTAGIPLVEAIDIAKATIMNERLRQEINLFGQMLHSGASFAAALKEAKYFPPLMATMVAVAEETSQLSGVLSNFAGDYETQLNRSLSLFVKLLEPFLILFIGIAVGAILLAILLPVFQMELLIK